MKKKREPTEKVEEPSPTERGRKIEKSARVIDFVREVTGVKRGAVNDVILRVNICPAGVLHR